MVSADSQSKKGMCLRVPADMTSILTRKSGIRDGRFAEDRGYVSASTFTKADRLRKRSEFLYLAEIGRRIQNRYFVAVFASGRSDRSRLGITVTRRVGNAVHRNRIKRWIRECFRRHRARLQGTWDINVIAKNGAVNLASEDAYRCIGELFDEISSSQTD
ncbi:Ribonuclease P protein component (EC [Olavius algarvensis associated proteobacterium Delta 3]|nr:Ribonuclease P protein component (EC [Olavius algarvensis associated proteobacterium Delta 3]